MFGLLSYVLPISLLCRCQHPERSHIKYTCFHLRKLFTNDANVALGCLSLLTEGFPFHFRSQSRDPSG